MKKTTIENIYSSKKTMFIIKMTLLCCLLLVFIIIPINPFGSSRFAFFLFIIFIALFIIENFMLYYHLREVYLFFKNNNQTETEIIWWNYDDTFLTDDKIIIASLKVNVFRYSDIKYIQKERREEKGSHQFYDPCVAYFLHIVLYDETHFKILMYNFSKGAKDPYDNIEDITNLLLEKNPNIIVEKQFNYVPFGHYPYKK